MDASVAAQMAIIRRHQEDAPVQVVPIATALGINVYRATGWSDQISGRVFRSIAKGGDSGFAIEVNADHSDVRRRFTIAHEIAHCILHPNHIGYVSANADAALYDDAMYRSGLTNIQETQANSLAAKILMPEHLLMRYGPSDRWEPTRMAMRFNVSVQSMSIRLGVFA